MDTIIIAIIGILGVMAYKFRALDGKGTLAAAFLGVFTLELGGIYPFLALLTFVIFGILATKYKFSEKIKKGIAQEGKGIRSWRNVFGNGLAALIFLIVEYYTKQDIFWAATFSAIATANADTLASELGKIWGKHPRIITTLEPALPGDEGAVSLQGEVAALIGGFAIALFALFLTQNKTEIFVAVTLGGFLGCNIDSVIGATLERKGLVNNHHTNFLATLLGGIAGALIFFLL
ncbi:MULTISPECIES: TIGR00297 family protein [Thermococcus]|uniref:Integral membrane protein n=1 Tax=Thermococcus sibiricus (strain DSM 12597 / MM 739) TaxID=604354 RepID=C6A3X5_THESM|nr:MULTISPECIES: TIGR00297 family protein [Thermococcus]ACS90320.1 Integral membrane protein [Thermococcus sibiricus MM 739]MBC7095664.1 TIGR00297 family protein [Thermococcus sp.]